MTKSPDSTSDITHYNTIVVAPSGKGMSMLYQIEAERLGISCEELLHRTETYSTPSTLEAKS